MNLIPISISFDSDPLWWLVRCFPCLVTFVRFIFFGIVLLVFIFLNIIFCLFLLFDYFLLFCFWLSDFILDLIFNLYFILFLILQLAARLFFDDLFFNLVLLTHMYLYRSHEFVLKFVG